MTKSCDISSYATIIFDCDGVVLDSNFVKAEAFGILALPYGRDASSRLVDYHLKHSAISRHVKIKYLLDEILPESGFQGSFPSMESLLRDFASLVSARLRLCSLDPFIHQLRVLSGSSSWMMASGAEEAELVDIMRYHSVDSLFDKGIYGGPTPKLDLLMAKFQAGEILSPSLFVGDSLYDYECSKSIKADFVFVSHWTCEPNWSSFTSLNQVCVVDSLACLAKAQI